MATLKKLKNGFQDQLSLNAGKNILTFINLPDVTKTFVLYFLSGRSTQVLLYFDISENCLFHAQTS